jgi:hypothetical protein
VISGLKLVATLHNRRGDPLILLRFLRNMVKENVVNSVGVCWSLPSGENKPGWAELQTEEKRVQETLRNAVRLVKDSGLSMEAKTFLGRCYRSFQYEFMVSLNLKRHDRRLELVLFDEPGLRETRYEEIGSPREFLVEIAAYPIDEQEKVLRERYAVYRDAYDRAELYERMVFRPSSALLEISPKGMQFVERREKYMARVIKNTVPDVVLVRRIHCLENPSSVLTRSGLRSGPSLPAMLGIKEDDVMNLSEAEPIVGPLPARD